jgi:alpha-glucosidase
MNWPLFGVLLLSSVLAAQQPAAWGVKSPGGALELRLAIAESGPGAGGLTYEVRFRDKALIAPSRLGLGFVGQPVLGERNLRLVETKSGQVDTEWTAPHGKASRIRDRANTLAVTVEETAGLRRRLTVEARAADDAVAFRYVVPKQTALGEYALAREATQFAPANEGRAFPLFLNGYRTSYEDSYAEMPLTSLRQGALIGLPLLVEVPGAGWTAVTEAHLEDYAGLYLARTQGRALEARLAPRADEPDVAVRGVTPLTTPWRVLLVAAEPAQFIASNAVLNLNPPSRIADTSWIRPGKTSWSWWSGDLAKNVSFKPGMNTDTLKHYIDFSAAAGLEYVLIDEGWSGDVGGRARDLTRTNPAVDLPAVLAYAKSKNVRVWLWAYWTFVDQQMDEAFPLFEKWGVAGVKVDFMDRDDQTMLGFYHRTARKAAGHKLLLDFHGAYKPTGMSRYWPNVLTYEGGMGLEYLKWSARVMSEHNTTLPFTRLLAGPLDYTPGGFENVARAGFTPRFVNPQVPTTRAHQLALFVIIESAFQMLADYPGAYQGQHELPFLSAVPAAWDETVGVAGEPGVFVGVARRKGANWYVGSITNRHAREIDFPLGFLGPGKWTLEAYADVPARPAQTDRQQMTVDRNTRLKLALEPDGGHAAILRPAR